VLLQLQCSELEVRRDQLRAEMLAVEARLASLCAPGANETKEAPLPALPSQSTAITSLSAMRIPFSEQLVRSGETIVGNLVVAAQAEFLAARFAAFFLKPTESPRARICLTRFGPLGRLNYAAGEYIAVANGGGIRAGLEAGPVYKEDLVAMLPFSNELRFAIANGTVVKQMLEHSVRNDGPSGGFLSVHGLQFWWDPKGKPGERVQRVMVRSNRKHGARA
jgi:hypothetical protein